MNDDDKKLFSKFRVATDPDHWHQYLKKGDSAMLSLACILLLENLSKFPLKLFYLVRIHTRM